MWYDILLVVISVAVAFAMTLEIVEDDPPWFSILQDAELFGTPA